MYSSSSQNELLDNFKMYKALSNSEHNQIHFGIKTKPESKNTKYKRSFSTVDI